MSRSFEPPSAPSVAPEATAAVETKPSQIARHKSLGDIFDAEASPIRSTSREESAAAAAATAGGAGATVVSAEKDDDSDLAISLDADDLQELAAPAPATASNAPPFSGPTTPPAESSREGELPEGEFDSLPLNGVDEQSASMIFVAAQSNAFADYPKDVLESLSATQSSDETPDRSKCSSLDGIERKAPSSTAVGAKVSPPFLSSRDGSDEAMEVPLPESRPTSHTKSRRSFARKPSILASFKQRRSSVSASVQALSVMATVMAASSAFKKRKSMAHEEEMATLADASRPTSSVKKRRSVMSHARSLRRQPSMGSSSFPTP